VKTITIYKKQKNKFTHPHAQGLWYESEQNNYNTEICHMYQFPSGSTGDPYQNILHFTTFARKVIIEQLVFYAIAALQRSLQLHHDDDDHDHGKEGSKFLPNTTQNPQEACHTSPPNET
jgi:hypothetical protein